MSNSTHDIHKQIHLQYLGQHGQFNHVADLLQFHARNMLERAKLFRNLDKAIKLKQEYDLVFNKSKATKSEKQYSNLLFIRLTDCYEIIVDDLLLLSAFELFAKSRLVRNDYVIHNIDDPKTLKKNQNKRPIHCSDIRKNEENGVGVTFSGKTIPIDYLNREKYLSHYPLNESSKLGLKIVRERRNLVHFQYATFWTVEPELLEFVKYLRDTIPENSK